MSSRPLEIIPLRDEPEPYVWTSPELAEYYTVYERDADGLANALLDLPTLDDALTYALRERQTHAYFWTGSMLVEVTTTQHSSQVLQGPQPWRVVDLLPHEIRALSEQTD